MIKEEKLEAGTAHTAPSQSVSIDVFDVTYGVVVDGKVKRLLKNVNCSFNSGSMVALMGPSGAGKSTLLDMLADRKLVGSWSGDIYVDGRPRTPDFRLRTAYVLQDDVHIPTLTVEESVYYACWSRCVNIKTREQIQERVDHLLKMMGIDHVRKSIIGDPMRKGISGGQLKRLSIAVELVTLPDVIFLDEPTSGLDSSIALEVMSAVQEITGKGKLCISTIHQPSPEVFGLFDRVVLMVSGRLIFAGATSDAVSYFTRPQLGYKYTQGTNPAEFIIAVGGGSQLPEGSVVPRHADELEALYRSSKFYQPVNIANLKRGAQDTAPAANPEFTSPLTQLLMLMHRTWLAKVRDYADLKAQLIKNFVVGLVVGIVFYNQGDATSPLYSNGQPKSEVSNCSSILFFTMMYTMVGNLQAIPYLSSQTIVYRRELASNAYFPMPYFISQLITTLPIQFGFHFLFIICAYFLVNLPSDGEYFFYFLFLLFFANTCAYYSAMWLAAATDNEQLAFALFPILFLFLAQFAGYSITLDSIPSFWVWAPYVSYARWVFEGLMVNEWTQFSTDDAADDQKMDGNGDVLSIYSFTGFDKNDAFGIVFLYILGFAALTYYALLPPANKLEKLEPGSMTASAVKSMFEKKKVVPRAQSSISVWGDNGAQNLLRETLLSDTHEPDEDDVIKPQVQFTVDFYRVSSGMIDKADGCNVVFKNVNYIVTDKLDSAKKTQLLDNVSGQVKPGEMCALMGASGAGKSTLLDVLAQRKTTGEISGEILYNGSTVLRSTAYVMQDNVHIGLLTVRESLYFAAQLRLPEEWPIEKKEKRVDKILDMLGLTEVANTLVGNHSIRGISGGQTKRLSIGVEIINLPNIMFLDEPTTGLDSSISLEVMSAVRNLANQNRTVICTIHQPSHATFELFDTLLLLAKGRVIYFGNVNEVIEYFMHSSPYHFHYKAGTNPADYVIAVAGSFLPASDGRHIPGDELAEYYVKQRSANPKFVIDPRKNPIFESGTLPAVANFQLNHSVSQAQIDSQEELALEEKKYITSTSHQMKILSHRAFIKTARDRKATVAATGRHIIVSLFYGSIYFQLATGTASSDYTNRLGLFFFSLMFMIIGHQQAVPAILDDRLIFYRERGAKAYGPFSYWISSWLMQIPLILGNVLLFSIILYNMAGLNTNSPEEFWYFYLIMLLTSYCGYYVACFISSISPSTQAALSYYPIVLFFSVSFAGFLVYIPQFPAWLGDWAPYISFMRYGFQGLTLNEFHNNPGLSESSTYISNLGFNDFNKTECATILFLWVIFYAFTFLWALKFINFEER